ncbi:MAG: mobile mystery protein A [Bacteroidota bacterium]|nr:mobile mystery protein A [Bacteroidota bacterium]
MKYNNKKLQISQIDEQLNDFKDTVNVPKKGWVHTIRTSLSMTALQLAEKLKTSPQAILALEKREEEGKITIKKLKEIGAAMELKLVYGFVHTETLEKMVKQKAIQLATKIVMRTSRQMELEDQKISDKKLKKAIEDRAEEIIRTLPKIIWD